MKAAFSDALGRLVAWVRHEALPLWLAHAQQTPSGWFCHRLTAEGKPDTSTIFLAAQARMIYVIARAEQLGWISGRHRLVRDLIDLCGRHGTLPCRSDGYVRSLAKDLSILDQQHDLTAHALFIQANAACFAVYGENSDLRRAYNIVDWLNVQYAHPNGGWREGGHHVDRRSSRSHRQMLLALLALSDVTRKPIWRQRANELFRVAVQNFFAPHSNDVIADYFDETWRPVSLAWTPEEQFGWVHAFSRCRGIASQRFSIDQVYQNALAAADAQGVFPAVVSGAETDRDAPRGAAALVASIIAGIDLVAMGATDLDDLLGRQIDAFFQYFVPRHPPGIFLDVKDDPDACASAEVLMLLCDAAGQAAQLLRGHEAT